MMALTPGTTTQDAAGALAILQVIADPAKAKARLDELLKAAQEAGETLDAATEKLALAQKLEEQLKANKAELDKGLAELTAARASLKAERDALTQERSVHSKAAADHATEVSAFVKQRDDKNRELGKREQAVATREEQAKKTLEAAEALQAEYLGKLKHLKSIAA